jgi:hypothetical protein
VLLVIAAVAAVVLLRKQAAPEAARLLPECDAVVYVDFVTVRNLTGLDRQFSGLAPAYDEFVKATGFAFERDLDEAAMAIHRGGAGARTTRYTEILSGRYDQTKLADYLRPRATSVEVYRNTDVFSVPIENRTLRIALLAIDTVAISNVENPGVIHGIIDRFKIVALPFGGPSLMRRYYRQIPIASLLWAIAHIPGRAGQPEAGSSYTLPGGIDVGLPGDSDVVVSLRMLAAIHARADFYTRSEQTARQFAEQTGAFLALFRSIQAGAIKGGGDPDVKAVFDSIQMAQKGDRDELTATIPVGFLRKLISEPHSEARGEPEQPSKP